MPAESSSQISNAGGRGARRKLPARTVSIALSAISFCAVLVAFCQKLLSPAYPPTYGLERASINCTPQGLLVAHSKMTSATSISRNGSTLRLIKLPSRATDISGSPATNLLAYSAVDGSGASHIYTFSLVTGAIRQLTHGHYMDTAPKMSEDGTVVYFVRSVTPGMMVAGWVDSDVYSVRIDGSQTCRLSERRFVGIHDLALYPDKSHILFSSTPDGGILGGYSSMLFQVDLSPTPSSYIAGISDSNTSDAYLSAGANKLAIVKCNVKGDGSYDSYLIDAKTHKTTDMGKNGVISITASPGIPTTYYAIPENSSGNDLLYRSETDSAWRRAFVDKNVRPFAYTEDANGTIVPMKLEGWPM